jgi:guanine deaminase
MPTPEEFMRRAIALSRQNMLSNQENPFGAVVARGSEFIAEGVTQRIRTNDPSAHAELVAIRAAAKALGSNDLSGCDIYASGEPCPMCTALIWTTGIRTTYYGNSAADFAALGLDTSSVREQVRLPMEQRARPHIRLLADEAKLVLAEWQTLPQFARATQK